MSDPLERARHFRSRAVECEALADLASSEELGKEYRTIASHYLALAEAEELLVKKPLIGARQTRARLEEWQVEPSSPSVS